jgi:hypothetical protein
MNTIIYDNGTLKYVCTSEVWNTDTSWDLKVDSVIVVGAEWRMIGDTESLFLWFIDIDGKSYGINTTQQSNFMNEELNMVLHYWNLNYREISIPNWENSRIFYPDFLAGRSLFDHTIFESLIDTFRTIQRPRKLSSDVIKYLASLK